MVLVGLSLDTVIFKFTPEHNTRVLEVPKKKEFAMFIKQTRYLTLISFVLCEMQTMVNGRKTCVSRKAKALVRKKDATER